jgi:DNA-binding beta-propeller fold protein YncE
MFVADSESNIIRAIELPPVNRVTTLAGGDLFDFGDKDGTGDAVRFQHPLGVAYHDGAVYIADTYNHRIKRLDPRTGRVATYAGTGRPGHQDGPVAKAQFYEPGGLSVAGDQLYVADTNNHAVRAINLRTHAVTTLRFMP